MDHVVYTIKWLKEDYEGRFKSLYKMMYKRLYIFARNFLMDEALADDVVQEIFVGLWQKGKQMNQEILLERYLFTSVRNLCIDHFRRLNIIDKYQRHLLLTETMVLFPYSEEESEKEQRMMQVFKKLPEMQRQVLELSIVEGLKYKEIAERLNIAEGTVHTHIKRAYKFLKSHLLMMYLCLWLFFKYCFN